MNAILFPGQGSQTVGMGLEFYENFKIVKEIFARADDKLKFSLSKIILNGPEEKLQLTKNTQPAILTLSYSIFKVLEKEFNFEFNTSKFFAGHSLGEYSALVCSNSVNFEDALYLLHERGKAMQEAVPVGQGSMSAVLGLKFEELIKIINDNKIENEICEIANDNAVGQIIISGEKQAVEKLSKKLRELKIKTIPLKVSAPFHCSLMKPAAEKMKQKISNVQFNIPNVEIVSNVNGKPTKDPSLIKNLLVEQIYSTVKWRESLENIHQSGVNNFIEIGPGKTLTGMVKRTLKEAKTFSINKITDIEMCKDEFKK